MRQGVLADIVSFANGKSIKPGGQGVYPVFGANGIIGGSDNSNHEDAIILGRVGAYCGAVEQSDDKFWASDNTIVVKPKENNFSKLYTYYLLKFLDLNKFAGGSAQPLLTQTTLKQVPIRYHDNEGERDLIGLMLSSYDNLIENNNRRIAILEDMAQSLYREWFVKFRYPGHENQTLIDSPLGSIPEGWGVMALGEFAQVTMGLSPKGDTYNEDGIGTPLVNGPVEFGDKYTKKIKWTTAPTRMCDSGDLIVCVRGSTTGKFVKSDGEYCLGRGVCSINSDYQGFASQLFKVELPKLLAQTSGSTFPSWTGPQLKSYSVPIPPIELLQKFEDLVRPMNSLILTLSKKTNIAANKRDMLLPKLISGKIKL